MYKRDLLPKQVSFFILAKSRSDAVVLKFLTKIQAFLNNEKIIMDREYESKILPNGKKYSELRIFIRALHE